MLYRVCVVQPRGTGVFTMGSACSGIWAKLPTQLHGRCDLRAAGVYVEEGRGGRQRPRWVSREDPGSWLQDHCGDFLSSQWGRLALWPLRAGRGRMVLWPLIPPSLAETLASPPLWAMLTDASRQTTSHGPQACPSPEMEAGPGPQGV